MSGTALPLAGGAAALDATFGLPDAEADMRRHLRLREAVFAALDGVEVEGVPAASLVEEALDVDCSTGTLREPGPAGPALRAERVALLALPWVERLRGRRRAWPSRVGPGRVLIDVASTGHNCRRIWEPVARHLGPERCVLLVPQGAPERDRLPGFEWVRPARVPVDWAAWRATVRQGYGTWIARARTLEAHGIGPRGARRLARTLALQALRILQARALLDLYRPSAILSLADRGASGAPLVGAARAAGVPTLTIIHCPAGRTFGRTFVPLNADRLLVWGEYQRSAFADFGVPADRLAVVGCPGVERPRPDEAAVERLRARGVPDRPYRVLAVTGPMRDEWRARWFDEIAEAARRTPDAAFVARVHPSESAAFYRARSADVTVLENADLGLDETLAAVDAVVVHGSSIGLDALVHGRDLLVLDCLPFTLGTMREVVDAGAGTRVTSGGELAEALASLRRAPAGAAPRRDAARAFVDAFLASYGDDAAARVVKEIEAAAGRC